MKPFVTRTVITSTGFSYSSLPSNGVRTNNPSLLPRNPLPMSDAQYILSSHIDSTMRSTFVSCPQKFRSEFCLGLRQTEISIDLHAGACFSATLERFYREVFFNGCDTTVALGRAYATFTHEWGDFVIRKEKHPKTPENMWAAIESYVATYPPRTDPCQPYFTDGVPSFEFSFAIPLDFPGFPLHPSGDPFIYTGRFDMFGKWNNLPVVRDEKTAQRLEYNWAEKWDLRAQFFALPLAAPRLQLLRRIQLLGTFRQSTSTYYRTLLSPLPASRDRFQISLSLLHHQGEPTNGSY